MPAALAKPLPKKVKNSAPEVYSAIESTGSIPDSSGEPEVLPRYATASATPPQRTLAKPASTFKAPPFDSVPPEQRALIAQRLALIEKLILEQGRAYDYRTLTVAQLVAIAEHLKPKTPPAPTPPAAPKLDEATPQNDAGEGFAESYAVSDDGHSEGATLETPSGPALND